MGFFRSINISNQKDFACQASRGKQPFPHEAWCTVPPLQSRNQDPLCGHAPHTPSLVPSSLCLFEALCKGFDFFFPFFSISYLSLLFCSEVFFKQLCPNPHCREEKANHGHTFPTPTQHQYFPTPSSPLLTSPFLLQSPYPNHFVV